MTSARSAQTNHGSPSEVAAKVSTSPRRAVAGPAILSQGFRPFFLAAGIWAAGVVALWLAVIAGALVLPGASGAIVRTPPRNPSWRSGRCDVTVQIN